MHTLEIKVAINQLTESTLKNRAITKAQSIVLFLPRLFAAIETCIATTRVILQSPRASLIDCLLKPGFQFTILFHPTSKKIYSQQQTVDTPCDRINTIPVINL